MKIFLATVESKYVCLRHANAKIRNAFISFYGLRLSKNDEKINLILSEIRDLTTGLLVCDSGAHTFFAEVPEKGFSASGHNKKTKTKMSVDDYFEKYLQFLKKYAHYLDYFVELDIGEITGQVKVEEWREVLKKEELFNKCITCHHPSIMDLEYFENMCKESESKYLAVEGDRPMQRAGRLDYTTLIRIARKHGCRIHGFAMTKPDAMKTYPFFSVDSSSWISFWAFGVSSTRKMSKEKQNFERCYVKTDKGRNRLFLKEIEAWNKREDYFTNLWKVRGIVWD